MSLPLAERALLWLYVEGADGLCHCFCSGLLCPLPLTALGLQLRRNSYTFIFPSFLKEVTCVSIRVVFASLSSEFKAYQTNYFLAVVLV